MNIDLERLARMIAMFDSDNAGVRAAAFNRVDALIEAAGEQWTDVLAAMFTPKDVQPMRLSGVEFGHVDRCRELLRDHNDYLSAWERGFLAGICEKMHLSRKERSRFAQIDHNVFFRRNTRSEFGGDAHD
jgi:hypothetical protein